MAKTVFVESWKELPDSVVNNWWKSVQNLAAPRGPNLEGYNFKPHTFQDYKCLNILASFAFGKEGLHDKIERKDH